jgi:hypothetical protein
MASLAEQLPALIGVLLGAGATFGATFATDRARWHREQSVRWDVKRADAYAEYAFAVKASHISCCPHSSRPWCALDGRATTAR